MRKMRPLIFLCLFTFIPSNIYASNSRSIDDLYQDIFPKDQFPNPPFELKGESSSNKKSHSSSSPNKQTQLLLQWEHLKTKYWSMGQTPKEQLLYYAFGEMSLDQILSSSYSWDRIYQFNLGELLFKECHFNESITVFKQCIDLNPDFELDALSWKSLKYAISYSEHLKLVQEESPDIVFFDPNLKLLIDNLQYLFPNESESIQEEFFSYSYEHEIIEEIEEPPLSINTGESLTLIFEYIQSDSTATNEMKHNTASLFNQFFIHRRNKNWPKKKSVVLDLETPYHGEIKWSLYYFQNQFSLNEFKSHPSSFSFPYRKWTRTYAPLFLNNTIGMRTWSEKIEDLEEGYYIATAKARYSPTVAVKEFTVSEHVLFITGDQNQSTLLVTDRVYGDPKPGQPLIITYDFTPLLEPILKHEKIPFHADLEQGFKQYSHEKEMDFSLWSQGNALRHQYKKDPITLRKATNENGLVRLPTRHETFYEYKVRAYLEEKKDLTQVSYYPKKHSVQSNVHSIIWKAEPYYCAGETLHMKGLYRESKNGYFIPFKDQEVKKVSVSILNQSIGRLEYSKSHDLNQNGSYHLAWSIPSDLEAGSYPVQVNGDERNTIHITEKRKQPYLIHHDYQKFFYIKEPAFGRLKVTHKKNGLPADVDVKVEILNKGKSIISKHYKTNSEGLVDWTHSYGPMTKSKDYQLKITIQDDEGSFQTLRQRLLMTEHPYRLNLEILPDSLHLGDTVNFILEAKSYAGTPISGMTFQLNYTETLIETDRHGIARITLNHLKEEDQKYEYTLKKGAWEKKVKGELYIKQDQDRDILKSLSPELRNIIYTRGIQIPKEKADQELSKHLKRDFKINCQPSGSIQQPFKLQLQIGTREDKFNQGNIPVLLVFSREKTIHSELHFVSSGVHNMNIQLKKEWCPFISLDCYLFEGDSFLKVQKKIHVHDLSNNLHVYFQLNPLRSRSPMISGWVQVEDYKKKPISNAEISLTALNREVIEHLTEYTTDTIWRFRFNRSRKDSPLLFQKIYQNPIEHVSRHQYDFRMQYKHPYWWLLGPKFHWGSIDQHPILNRIHFQDSIGIPYGYRSRSRSYPYGSYSHSLSLPFLKKDKKKLVYWNPALITDQYGRAKFSFESQDKNNIVLFAEAISTDLHIGQGELKLYK